MFFPVGWGCRIHRLYICRGVRTPTNQCPGYDTKLHGVVGWDCRMHCLYLCSGIRPPPECPRYDTTQSGGEVPVMLELWGMWSTPSLALLPGPLRPGMVAPYRALSIG